MPTPAAMEPINMIGSNPACFDIIRMLGSAHVINDPNRKANTITIMRFFCLDKEAPIYSPTLISPF